ncbi:MAG: group III truncated hemoglobin [Bacteroidetes bacterium]|nr:MAG: group III truncated hemoglobin [Bacteroidota bacterium]
MEKKDIQNRNDIDQLMRQFYDKLLSDDDMAPIFEKVVAKGLEDHFDILVDFWDNILFFTGAYKNNAMAKHMELNAWFPLKEIHFKKWLDFFNESVMELFEGEKATLAMERAQQIAILMQMKIVGNDSLI